MLATPTFYFMWVAYCLGTTAGQMTISQLVPFAGAAGLGALAATLVLPVSATRQRRRPHPVGLDVRHAGPSAHA